jgi:hypothetical protein
MIFDHGHPVKVSSLINDLHINNLFTIVFLLPF